MHLVEDARAVHFHRAHADVQFIGDELVGPAVDDQLHHLTLALGQLGQRALQRVLLAARQQRLRALRQRQLHAIDQGVVGKRLLNKVESAALDRRHRCRHVTMAGEEDHRQQRQQPAPGQALEEHQAAGARHAHIQHQAGRRRRPGGAAGCRLPGQPGLEGIGAAKTLGHQAARAQQPGQRVAHDVFVVHQVDHRDAEAGVEIHGRIN